MDQLWANRAASAETAVFNRHLRRLWGLPGTQLGVVAWPSTRGDRLFKSWDYWWQAHLLDCLVDAQLRDPQEYRVERITRQIRGHRLRNNGSWTNSYYDDMAWMALALERSGRLVGVARPKALKTFADQFLGAWVPEDGGGIPWRKQDQFFNAPANGPAGIFLARHDRLRRAQQMADWLDDTLIDPDTHLVFDGIKAGSMVRAEYTYCQGVVLGLEVELAVRTGDSRHAPRVHRLVAAVNEHMADDGVIKGAGGGDGGLFGAILARYLTLVATDLPGDSADDEAARETARTLVLTSAQSAWDYRQSVNGIPLFGAFWDRAAELPKDTTETAKSVDGAVNSSEIPERDLSVQVAGWMLMEAAYMLTADAEVEAEADGGAEAEPEES
ncbi:fructose-bisphosphate aldolase [Mycobacterium sp. CBMA293]|uniref:glycoside hydrolase family 76 protein n=1 Tax=unclassified Mycolicibacterium TaxID=2636767 RepID=UPI0012DD6DA5|nr:MULTISPECIES: glycoside hydrolase family 76 protein [unclassified Mycolicibacterium]MUL47738.1 fructose-bisphosphate aldolase [Mycolicibacterium sp. CBMA 360]MUL61744.1 fructose-bisphosphate aldolase [Mycolicibacterium sp. CBMA 335]MUL70808.1 fructose-bisphosphate aldolase [Mycolicibacterium sp. CBMA 311]MUL92966.1 fructose-bisphosphate aldolase [Mycolicibacterium sp. CBMA 230]MUM08592.1 fructose-bisphosphate aldolase [Mycolicibacterium sp. CBMA 213]